MKSKFKEASKKWRKSALGLVVLSSALHARRHMPPSVWHALPVSCSLFVACAWLQPRRFLGYCRLSSSLGFYSGRLIGCYLLAVFFIFILTPLGWVMRLIRPES